MNAVEVYPGESVVALAPVPSFGVQVGDVGLVVAKTDGLAMVEWTRDGAETCWVRDYLLARWETDMSATKPSRVAEVVAVVGTVAAMYGAHLLGWLS